VPRPGLTPSAASFVEQVAAPSATPWRPVTAPWSSIVKAKPGPGAADGKSAAAASEAGSSTKGSGGADAAPAAAASDAHLPSYAKSSASPRKPAASKAEAGGSKAAAAEGGGEAPVPVADSSASGGEKVAVAVAVVGEGAAAAVEVAVTSEPAGPPLKPAWGKAAGEWPAGGAGAAAAGSTTPVTWPTLGDAKDPNKKTPPPPPPGAPPGVNVDGRATPHSCASPQRVQPGTTQVTCPHLLR
jgi:hypothetical protein